MSAAASTTSPIWPRSDSVIKWGASIAQIGGYTATAFEWAPFNIYLFLIGLVGWFTVGVLWKDRAIMLIHCVALGAMVVGMMSQ